MRLLLLLALSENMDSGASSIEEEPPHLSPESASSKCLIVEQACQPRHLDADGRLGAMIGHVVRTHSESSSSKLSSDFSKSGDDDESSDVDI